MAEFIERFSLAGKTALVTGASRGTGLEIARVLADAGADIVAAGRDVVGLAQVKRDVETMGRRCLTIAVDLADVGQTRGCAKAALEHCGVVDILVNNAGVTPFEPLLDASVDDWDATMAINLRAPFVLAQTLAPQMIGRGGGKIVNVSSQAGVVAFAGHAAYAASKGGLNMLTKVMSAEWSRHNVQSNAVCPAEVPTPASERARGVAAESRPILDDTPRGRTGQPIEVADAVLFLSCAASDPICGETLLIDGGFTAR